MSKKKKSPLDSLMSIVKNETLVVSRLDMFLLSKNGDKDRAIDVNSPSQVGTCLRARYYARNQEDKDVNAIQPRTRRIFDTGHALHERTQNYLKEEGILIQDEVPVRDDVLNIQGHTDGLLMLDDDECAIFEYKTINEHGFKTLITIKPEHYMQGLVYLYCMEQRRKQLKRRYKDLSTFLKSYNTRKQEYLKNYTHIEGGKKHTKDEKLALQVKLNNKRDLILFKLKKPITKVCFIYENKNTSELKEFIVSSEDKDSKVLIDEIIADYTTLNTYVENQEIPPRITTKKSDASCRYCDYKDICWVV